MAGPGTCVPFSPLSCGVLPESILPATDMLLSVLQRSAVKTWYPAGAVGRWWKLWQLFSNHSSWPHNICEPFPMAWEEKGRSALSVSLIGNSYDHSGAWLSYVLKIFSSHFIWKTYSKLKLASFSLLLFGLQPSLNHTVPFWYCESRGFGNRVRFWPVSSCCVFSVLVMLSVELQKSPRELL